MRQIFDFVKTTVVGGAIFLLPFAAVLLIVIKAGKMAVDSATPLAEKLPISKGEAVLAVYLVGTFVLVLVAFTAGLFVRSFKIEKDAASFLENKVLNKLPPYVALRKYTDRLAGLEGKTNEDLKPVLVRMPFPRACAGEAAPLVICPLRTSSSLSICPIRASREWTPLR